MYQIAFKNIEDDSQQSLVVLPREYRTIEEAQHAIDRYKNSPYNEDQNLKFEIV